MTLCVFQQNVCVQCGVPSKWPDAPRNCRRLGLGDIVANGLNAIGITKERVSAIVGGDCGCQQRQEWLNKAGHAIGIGTKPNAETP